MPTARPDRRAMAVAVLWQGSAMPARPPARRLEWDQVLGWRLRRHHLDQRAPSGELLAVVAEIADLHAQVMSSAELTLWTRVDGLDRQAVRDALWRDRNLVKTWAMRGTLHLLPAAEYPLWQAALSTRRGYERGSWQRGFGVTLEQLQTMHGAIRQALDGQVLSREALAAEVASITGSPALGDKLRHSWGSLLKPAASQGLLCFGPSDGQLVRFTRPDQWLPSWRGGLDPEAALQETARRYLRACGAVTREDYARWWGVLAPAGACSAPGGRSRRAAASWSPSSPSPSSPPPSAAERSTRPSASPPGPAPPWSSPGPAPPTDRPCPCPHPAPSGGRRARPCWPRHASASTGATAG